ncbi:hypothetical protein SPBR_02095 [Sporothrix brasiliensis 5110]|uniref:Uncharacterized protein n=1 Tax=Sporothrix brasiliensis 5110 TaxID=1398154 RepID=A0A0C2IS24_9PEZI|nr:uncharacterized protein SPBR_02095 [Sporothrix brasiliensis 5110]KIH91836.1 hypothetical protein SPBR_02095 [Sporothrix brasiliensis 5110]
MPGPMSFRKRAVGSTDKDARPVLQTVGKNQVAEAVNGAVVAVAEVEVEAKETRSQHRETEDQLTTQAPPPTPPKSLAITASLDLHRP